LKARFVRLDLKDFASADTYAAEEYRLAFERRVDECDGELWPIIGKSQPHAP